MSRNSVRVTLLMHSEGIAVTLLRSKPNIHWNKERGENPDATHNKTTAQANP